MTSKRYILLEASEDLWFPVADRLYKDHQATPVYWSAVSRFQEKVMSRWPDAIFHDTQDAVRGIDPAQLHSVDRHPCDAQLLREMASSEAITLRMMDRLDYDGSGFTFTERRQHYYDLLSQWLTILDALKPDFAVAPTTPHQVYDYVAFALCKKLNIPFVCFERTSLTHYLYPITSIEEISTPVANAFLRGGASISREAAAEVDAHIQKIRADYQTGMPDYSRVRHQENMSFFGQYGRHIVRFLQSVIGLHHLDPRFDNQPLMKAAGSDYKTDRIRGVRAHWNRIRMTYAMRRRYRRFRSLAVQSDPGADYVLVALNYQPERTTSPNAGYYVDQYLMVKQLSQALPPGWLLYVKEHRRQFQGRTKPHLLGASRSQAFYDRISDLPNVSFLSYEADPFRLIDKARAVATTTGSMGWEALVRGRPALVFAQAWYSRCPGAFEIASQEMLVSALDKIKCGSAHVDSDVVHSFAHAILSTCSLAYTTPNLAKATGIGIEENASKISFMIGLKLGLIKPVAASRLATPE